MNEALMKNTPQEFTNFVVAWVERLNTKFDEIMLICGDIYNVAMLQNFESRKNYAEYFTTSANKRYSAILFAMLDKNVERIEDATWKLVELLVKGAHPMVTEDE